jgi:IS30 family transposase
VERHSRFAMLIKVPSKNREVVVAALSQHVRKLPAMLKRSLTWDRGLEMAKHKDFTVATDVQVYFCYPQSPWQRGTNENTNLLLRLLPSRHRPVWLFASAARPGLAAVESTPQKNPRLRNSRE